MKVRLKAEIIDDSGKGMTKTVEIKRDVPDIDEFGDPSTFYEVFDRYERPALEAQTELMGKLTEGYLGQAALKKGANIL